MTTFLVIAIALLSLVSGYIFGHYTGFQDGIDYYKGWVGHDPDSRPDNPRH